MTATNKAFAYVFKTPSEDHKVARVLSSRHPDKAVALLSLDRFDTATQAKIRSVSAALLTASSGLETSHYNVNERVLDTLMAYLLRHYPSVKQLNAEGLAIQRLEACSVEKGFTTNTLLAWSSHLTSDPNPTLSLNEPKPKTQQWTAPSTPCFVTNLL
ncbi:hypothetical protein PC128_g24523 [Phytophthora cactorum]|nr:hypothetical protein PC120_g23670 [Phytophthora cactorum]KAG3143823.1 hypothetical protein PC128_g24523 [Phytophthora cactorum]KAG4040234.1 hypothetical protein PC123_g24221 [Phytophthora cactorum]